jgi:hypothetical protein
MHIQKLKVAQVYEVVRDKLRSVFGDSFENKTRIYATHGFWYLNFPRIPRAKKWIKHYENIAMRRSQLAAFLKKL